MALPKVAKVLLQGTQGLQVQAHAPIEAHAHAHAHAHA